MSRQWRHSAVLIIMSCKSGFSALPLMTVYKLFEPLQLKLKRAKETLLQLYLPVLGEAERVVVVLLAQPADESLSDHL